MAQSPHIWYLMPFTLPAEHAHSIQIVHTCHALAQAGATVRLMVRRASGKASSVAEALAAYHLSPHPRLDIRWLPSPAGLGSGWLRCAVLCAPAGTVFYARHVRLAALLARAGRFPVIVELHDITPDTARGVKSAHGIVTNIDSLRDKVRADYHPAAPIEVIPNGVDLSLFRPVQGGGPPRLVYVGAFHDYKGVDVLIGALAKLPDLHALLIGGKDGDPQCDRLRRLAQSEGVADRTEWHPYLPQGKVHGKLRKGDIAIMPTRAAKGSDFNACPLKLLEYMACGLPIVASDLPSVRNIICPGENGLLFREGDADSLAGAVRTLIEGPSLCASLAAQALKDAQVYSWQGRAERILSFIERVRSRS